MTGFALGIDVGTTGVKAVLLDGAGRVVTVAGNEHGIEQRPGVVEADPRRWWDSVCSATRRLAAQAGDLLSDVVTVGLTGNMSSVVLLDDHLEPLGNAALLADSRGARELAAMPQDLRDLLLARTLNQPATAFSLSTLLYLRDQAPETLGRTRVWVSAKDYIRLRLTDSVGTDLTDAYNSLLIPAGGSDWAPDLIGAVGLPRRIFPDIQRSDEPIGTVSAAAGARTGIPAGIPVVAGAGDVPAGALGAGIAVPGPVSVSLGTSVTVLAAVSPDAGSASWAGSLTYHPSCAGRGGLALASLLTGGLALNWLRELLGPQGLETNPEPLDSGDPLVFLPHLAGTGSPRFQPEASGSLLGLRPSTRGPHLVQALFEAIGFEIADAVAVLGAAPGAEILLSGGGTRLPAWVQTIADVLRRPVMPCAHADVSAVGAACLAWRGVTGDAPRLAAPTTRYEPAAARAAPLRTRAENYHRARDAMVAYYQPRSDQEAPTS